MVDRINLILKAKNLTSRQFAEEIGIQPSGMSHIMSGRNRPSLDFVMKVVTRYPEIDIKWLTLGEGEMYVNPYSMPVVHNASVSQHVQETPRTPVSAPAVAERKETPFVAPQEPDLFSAFEQPVEQQQEQLAASVPSRDAVQDAVVEQPETMSPEKTMPSSTEPVLETSDDEPHENRLYDFGKPAGAEKRNVVNKKIVKVVILYDDHSFSEYYPE